MQPDGSVVYREAFFAGLKPERPLRVSEWADKHRELPIKSTAEPGRWRTKRTPYLRDIMDDLSTYVPTEIVVMMKGTQVGATECGNNWLGYIIDHAPGPAMFVQPTTELMKRTSRQRIAPMIESTPKLRERVSEPRARDSGNTLLAKEFDGGILVMTGANSAVGLRSMPVRYLFLDEIDAYEDDIDGEGDPYMVVIKRTNTYRNKRKIFIPSTPTIKGASRV